MRHQGDIQRPLEAFFFPYIYFSEREKNLIIRIHTHAYAPREEPLSASVKKRICALLEICAVFAQWTMIIISLARPFFTQII